MFCKNCGAQNEDGTKFCSKCGSPLEAQQPNVQPQTVIIQQTVTQAVPEASPAEKEAVYSTTGSIWMLLAAIVLTISLFTSFIGDILSLNLIAILFGVFTIVLDILIVVGFWISFANGKKKKVNPTGINLIRVPYIIMFVFTVIRFVVTTIGQGLTFQWISLVFGILSFVFTCICFASVKKTLDMGLLISKNRSVAGRKAGIFAAVVMIISAAISFIQVIVGFVTAKAVADAVDGATGAGGVLSGLTSGIGAMSIVAGVISLLGSVSVAIVLLMFAKKIKKAING